jgi:ribonuclease P protein component
MKILSIKKSADFNQKNNKLTTKFHTNSFTLLAIPTNSFYFCDNQRKKAKIFCRFGLVVSKTASKLAVERNLIKRRFRSCFCNINGTLKQQHTDYIFIAKQATINFQYNKIKQDMQYALSNLAKFNRKLP